MIMQTKSLRIKKELNKMYLSFFILTFIFSFNINSIDTQYIFLLFWLMISLIKSKFNFKLQFCGIFFCLIFILFYSLCVFLVNNSSDYFYVLRYCRVILSLITISSFFSAFPQYLNKQYLLICLRNVLLLNSIIILLSILFPQIKEILGQINGYDKAFYSLRSTGLVSGYELAGFLCIVGFLIECTINIYNKNKLLNIYTFIFFLSCCFTSRISMIYLIISLILLSFFFVFTGKFKYLREILWLLIPIIIVGVLVIILTTDIGMTYRNNIYALFPQLIKPFDAILDSYTDYGQYTSYHSHLVFNSQYSFLEYFIGLGISPEVDPGYMKTIYYTGFIGYCLSIIGYLIISMKKRNNKFDFLVLFLFFLTFLFDLKIGALFSSCYWEVFLLVCFRSFKTNV